jgi:OOP family OmpA-OmpF porin
MLVVGPQRGVFLACLSAAIGSALALDVYFAPAALHERTPPALASPSASGPSRATPASASAPALDVAPPAPRAAIPAIARVPTIVARFDTEAKEPSDQTGIRALATALIEEHDLRVVLEGHSDTHGAGNYNQQISLARAEWVKSRLVEMGVAPERVETVGLGATRPLRSDLPDAQAMNRRVEIRWLGR